VPMSADTKMLKPRLGNPDPASENGPDPDPA
jgi:hypothetical protein